MADGVDSPHALMVSGNYSGFRKLPEELVRMISDFLPLASRISFALTCKHRYYLMFRPKSPRLFIPPYQKAELFLLLEKDMPGWLACVGCLRLCRMDANNKTTWRRHAAHNCEDDVRMSICKNHTRPSQYQRNVIPNRVDHYLPKYISSYQACEQGPRGSYFESRLVMNRHFYGADHGLPTSVLDKSFVFRRYLTLDSDPEIMNCTRLHDPWDLNSRVSSPGQTRYTNTLVPEEVIKKSEIHLALGSLPEEEQRVREQEERKMRFEALKASHQRRWRMVSQHPGPDPSLARSAPEHDEPWIFSLDRKARIIDDELYMKCIHTVDGSPLVDSSRFRIALEAICLPFCSHRYLTKYCNGVEADLLTVLRQEMASGGGVATGSCQYCFMDYEISVGDFTEPCRLRNWTVHLTTYHRLGGCRTLYDPAWNRLDALPDEVLAGRPQGAVRDRWHAETERIEAAKKD